MVHAATFYAPGPKTANMKLEHACYLATWCRAVGWKRAARMWTAWALLTLEARRVPPAPSDAS